MKLKRNEIIVILVAFLVGVFVAMAITQLKEDKEANNDNEVVVLDESNEEVSEEATQEVETAEAPEPVATPTPSTPPAQAPQVSSCTPSISGVKDETFKAIRLDWTTCPSEDFQFYKILKSSTSSSLSYPGSPVVVSSADKNLANHIDKTVARETTYNYRACVVERLGKISCGNTISVKY